MRMVIGAGTGAAAREKLLFRQLRLFHRFGQPQPFPLGGFLTLVALVAVFAVLDAVGFRVIGFDEDFEAFTEDRSGKLTIEVVRD